MDERLQKIKKQVEFYFGDANLPKDRFMREQIASDSDGYVKIETLCKFKRMEMLKATTEDIVKLFEGSAFLKTSDDNISIKRLTPLPAIDDSSSRKIHVKGFPIEVDQLELESFFDGIEPNGIAAVRMMKSRRVAGTDKPRTFFGAVFVEFKTVENMNSFLKKEDVKFNEQALEIKTFDDYIRGRDERKRKKSGDRKRKRYEELFDEKLKEVKDVYVGCLVKINGVPGEPKLTFKVMKKKIIEALGSADFFVEYPYKEDSAVAVVRFENKEIADKFTAGVSSGEMKIFGEAKVVFGELSDEEKEEFFRRLTERLLGSSNEPPHKKRKLD